MQMGNVSGIFQALTPRESLAFKVLYHSKNEAMTELQLFRIGHASVPKRILTAISGRVRESEPAQTFTALGNSTIVFPFPAISFISIVCVLRFPPCSSRPSCVPWRREAGGFASSWNLCRNPSPVPRPIPSVSLSASSSLPEFLIVQMQFFAQ